MAFTFIRGINPDLETALYSSLTTLNKKNTQDIDKMPELNSLAEEQKLELVRKLQELYNKSFEDFFKDVENQMKLDFIDPIINSVARLPKGELAIMAESLVHLTSLRKRFSMEAETVGGAIDVAVISKGDGFIWIKRKHYFNPELNPHFFKNYFK